jgi:hypothetical protein
MQQKSKIQKLQHPNAQQTAEQTKQIGDWWALEQVHTKQISAGTWTKESIYRSQGR